MKILYITTTGFDTFTGCNHLNESLIKKFLNNNFEVVLIQSNQGGPYDSVPKTLTGYNKLTIINIPQRKKNKTNKIMRYINEYVYIAKTIKNAKKLKDIDLIFFQNSGDSYKLIQSIRKLRVPIIFNMQDLFPETLLTTKITRSKLIYSIFKKRHIKAFKSVDQFTVLSEDMKNTLKIKYKIKDEKIVVVSNWFDDDNINEIQITNNRFALKYSLIKTKKVIQYAGNLGYVLDYDFLLSYLKLLGKHDDIEFQIIGNGSNEAMIRESVNRLEIKNVKFFDIQPNEIVSDVYSYADIVFIPLKQGVIHHSVPSKVGLVLACKRPILIIADSDSKFVKDLSQNHSAMTYSHTEVVKAYKETIWILNNSLEYKKMVISGFDYANREFSFKVSSEKILNTIDKVLRSKQI